ncbi:MAG: aspartate aminotransferase family protein [Candidatus Methylomirabilales bacterium]
MTHETSLHLYQRYDRIVPGGVHSNARMRDPHPLYFRAGSGARVWDVDGNEYLDCIIGYASCILGHADPDVTAAVTAVIEAGLSNGLETELSLRVAEQLHEMIPGAEQVRFAGTGTEAVMKSLMIARAVTGKGRIAKAEGGYNGWYDDVLVSVRPPVTRAGPRRAPRPVTEAAGLRDGLQTVVIPFNDARRAVDIILKQQKDLAAVMIEPVLFECGCIEPVPGYLETLREVTARHNILLIFDEIATGFRLAPGGAQERYGVMPDLAVFEKGMANGYPISAVVGSARYMQATHPRSGSVAYLGANNANQVPLAAAAACLAKLKPGGIQEQLQAAVETLRSHFNASVAETGVAARFNGIGGLFQVYFTPQPVTDYRSAQRSSRDAYHIFHQRMFEAGILMGWDYLSSHHGVSAAHSAPDIEAIGRAIRQAMRAVAGHAAPGTP